MNKALAKILLAQLADANYLDRTSGVVQTVVKQIIVDQENNVAIQRRLPYADSATLVEAGKMSEAMVPDSKYKSCLYFEDFGVTAEDTLNRRGVEYLSRLRLVCWLNMERIAGKYDTDMTARIMGDLIRRIMRLNNTNAGIFIAIKPEIRAIPVQDAGIFSPYDYDQAVTQYLFPPFDFFAIDIDITFRLGDPCIESFTDNIIQ